MGTKIRCLRKTQVASCEGVSAAVNLTSSMPLQKAEEAVQFKQTSIANPWGSLR